MNKCWREFNPFQRKILFGIAFRKGKYAHTIVTDKTGMQDSTIYDEMLSDKDKEEYTTHNDLGYKVLDKMVDGVIFNKCQISGEGNKHWYGFTDDGFKFVRKQKWYIYRRVHSFKYNSASRYKYFMEFLLPVFLAALLVSVLTTVFTYFFNKRCPLVQKVRLVNKYKDFLQINKETQTDKELSSNEL